MQFRSTRSFDKTISFKDAIVRCLPPDGGLYIPADTIDMRQFFLHMDTDTTFAELVTAITPELFQNELNPMAAARAAESAFVFEPDLKILDKSHSVLNLYNGPTGYYKDFGCSFLASVMEELLKDDERAMIVSTAMGDTGASVAKAFQGRKRMTAVILFPHGAVCGLDPNTFVPNGGNILPIQIEGTQDDCQKLVQELINDRPFAERYNVTSSNSINVGRLLPQSLYYLYAFIKIKKEIHGDLVFSVPSANFGHLIAGLYAWKFGMPVNGFIAAMNTNNAFGDFIRGKPFSPKPLVRTNTPSLDVANPTNYERLAAFYEESPAVMKHMVFPCSVSDGITLKTIEKVWDKYGIMMDTHGAVGFAAAESFLANDDSDSHVIIPVSRHPSKSADLIHKVTGQKPEMPHYLQELTKEVHPVAVIPAQLDLLEAAIASCC
ncbi:MAG: threonine synthase [Treponema sp.]|nr:threonine synthase [Treponema sp.]